MRVIQTATEALQREWREQLAKPLEEAAYAHAMLCKVAATPITSMALSGELYASKSGWLLLSVPNAVGRGFFAALDEPGAELPKDFNCHISVARPEELDRIGGVDKITERGKRFHYNLGGLKTVRPSGWADMSKVWFLSVTSPELQALRKSYGLSPLPMKNGQPLPFHCTIGVRRVGVLGNNEIAKAASELWRYSCPHCGGSQAFNGEPGTDIRFRGSAKCVDCGKGFSVCGPEGQQLLLEKQAKLFTIEDLDNWEKIKAHIAEPTPAQAHAGNYAKGHVKLHGYDVTIETGKGQMRHGVSKDGKKWSQKLHSHYGYICGVQKSKADGDHVDCFIGDHPESELIFVIDQVDPGTGKFDESKCLLAFSSLHEAREGYLANYEPGWRGLSKITPMTLPQFDWWLEHGDTGRPVSEQVTKTAALLPLSLLGDSQAVSDWLLSDL